jgi:hypothetical protein
LALVCIHHGCSGREMVGFGVHVMHTLLLLFRTVCMRTPLHGHSFACRAMQGFDAVLSDMCHFTHGNALTDSYKSLELARTAFEIAALPQQLQQQDSNAPAPRAGVLRVGGSLIMKLLQVGTEWCGCVWLCMAVHGWKSHCRNLCMGVPAYSSGYYAHLSAVWTMCTGSSSAVAACVYSMHACVYPMHAHVYLMHAGARHTGIRAGFEAVFR